MTTIVAPTTERIWVQGQGHTAEADPVPFGAVRAGDLILWDASDAWTERIVSVRSVDDSTPDTVTLHLSNDTEWIGSPTRTTVTRLVPPFAPSTCRHEVATTPADGGPPIVTVCSAPVRVLDAGGSTECTQGHVRRMRSLFPRLC